MLLSSFEKLGRDENVEFILFQPGAEQINDFYATRSVQLQISGTFHRLVTYFDRLSRLDRLVTIQDIKFTPVSDFSPTEKYLNTSLVLQVYRALTEAEIKAREEEKKQKSENQAMKILILIPTVLIFYVLAPMLTIPRWVIPVRNFPRG